MKAPFAALKGVRVRATRMCCTLCRQVSLSQHDLSRLGGSLRSGVNFINRDDSGGTGWATLTRRTCSVKQSALFSHSAQNIRISVERSLNYYSFAFSSPKKVMLPTNQTVVATGQWSTATRARELESLKRSTRSYLIRCVTKYQKDIQLVLSCRLYGFKWTLRMPQV